MNIKQLLEALEQLNEMAIINGVIEVNNEDITNKDGSITTKYPHFHWVYDHKLHFRFANRIPNNKQELKQLMCVKFERDKISDKQLNKILKDLNSIVSKGVFKGRTTYDVAFNHWQTLHPYRTDFQNEIIIF